jgi:murein DD-endopeptidase MepM/ murein hydrolase activator NlpD
MRPIRGIGAAALITTVLATTVAAPAQASIPARVAALQSALKSLHLYSGFVDGVRGPLTRHGIRAFQRRRGLHVDGIVGPETRRALGWRGKPGLGSRVMRYGDRGWDVAALQFLLQRAGHGPGRADGLFGPLTRAAVVRAQEAAGIGVDFPEPEGTPIRAAGVGTVIYAAYNGGGYGNLVVIQHRLGYTSWYGHMSRSAAHVGESVTGGTLIGYVGQTGDATGPHVHFEVRHYNTPINPVPLLLNAVASSAPGQAGGVEPEECAGRRRPTRRPPPGSEWIGRERLCR